MCKVAIIIVDYNGFDDTKQCIQSIINSDAEDYKIIVVDNNNGGSQNLKNWVDQIDACNYVTEKRNLGFSGGNNLGILFAERHFFPEYYLLINNDTEVDSHFMSEILSCADKNVADLYCGKIMYYSEPQKIWYAGGEFNIENGWTNHWGANEIDVGKYNYVKEVTFATGCYWLLPNATIKNIGLLSEDYFLYSEDTDYCLRIMNTGGKMIYCPTSIIYHKVSSSTLKLGKLQQYYYVRNDLMCLRKYCNRRFIVEHILIYICSVIRGTKNFSSVVLAIIDFVIQRSGQFDENKTI